MAENMSSSIYGRPKAAQQAQKWTLTRREQLENVSLQLHIIRQHHTPQTVHFYYDIIPESIPLSTFHISRKKVFSRSLWVFCSLLEWRALLRVEVGSSWERSSSSRASVNLELFQTYSTVTLWCCRFILLLCAGDGCFFWRFTIFHIGAPVEVQAPQFDGNK